jgi:hypothetical protein
VQTQHHKAAIIMPAAAAVGAMPKAKHFQSTSDGCFSQGSSSKRLHSIIMSDNKKSKTRRQIAVGRAQLL